MGIKDLLFDDSGQSLAEYSLIITLAAIAIISILLLFGQTIFSFYENIKKDVIEIF